MTEANQHSAKSFFDFTEATTAVLDLLEKQLPNCAVFVAYHDEASSLLRVVDFRGDESFGVADGQTFALPPVIEDRHVDPAPAIISSAEVREIQGFVGIPLELHDDTHFSTLCAVAREEDRFGHNEIELLTVLARVIVNELERELKEQELQQRHDDLVRSNRRLRVDAFTDALTGVANRRGFERALTREWKLCNRGTTESFLVLVDLDGFKAVNDRHGHAAGDNVLKLCAQALTEAGRDTDIVGRIGGDEFAAILVGCATEDEAMLYRERANAHLDELLAGQDARARFSAGHQSLAEAPSPHRAMELADQAMYWQKRQRSGRLPRGANLASKMKGVQPVR